ncbi:sigma-54 interaction domain-containing protein [Marinobacter sp. X15-166B]|uniref:sigma-54 interaction domain-containing protein n=1 Tax=Marinobacter sp. X15-166B TaxID=1897620 RepID=UPI00085CD8FC|nr:sigma 54-interacting transcriptional regulator [Marinobacter sp. X15-166B]OEY67913.1 AAA family ATPase [Marinobacter sp. X15-166B]
MQRELHTGIELAVELDRQPTLPALLQTAAGQIERTFGLPHCWLLELDLSGRSLRCAAVNELGEFDCGDFSHPFAHVLQQGNAKEVSRTASYRLDHPGFQSLLNASGRPESVWLHPVKRKDGRLLGVLMMCGKVVDWSSVVDQPLFLGILTLLAFRWAAHLKHSDEVGQRRLLKNSLDHLHASVNAYQHSERLAGTLIGTSSAMVDLRNQIVRAAGSQLAVLVQGETGCGKDLIAQGLHQLSRRAARSLVVVNCAAIPESLLESELFGHVKGAFSGADKTKPGLLAQADGGTLFLDEIGDMPLNLQAKLLRVLETGRFRPLGAQREQCSDFRLVAATHQPLHALIQDGRFRRDLFYRLSQFPLTVAPLRERPDDLEPLSRHFVRAYSIREGAGPLGVSSQALQHLAGYSFPGNVRELRNLIEFACLQTDDGEDIRTEHLRLDLLTLQAAAGETAATEIPTDHTGRGVNDLRLAAQQFEARIIRARLRQYGGNRAKAAASLGLPKRTLAYKCQKFNLREN